MNEILIDPSEMEAGVEEETLLKVRGALQEVAKKATAKGRKVRVLIMVARVPWEVGL